MIFSFTRRQKGAAAGSLNIALAASDPRIAERLSAVYAVAQKSLQVFASPLVSTSGDGTMSHVPRFVYFGDNASDESQRIAFYAGFDATDIQSTLSLLHFVEWISAMPDLGKGLALTFFPLVDILGCVSGTRDRPLLQRNWTQPLHPELALLEKDVRSQSYHGFVRLTSAPVGEEHLIVTVRGIERNGSSSLGGEIISFEDLEPLPARFVFEAGRTKFEDGPLSLGDDLPYAPFEITLSLPRSWSGGAHRAAVYMVLGRFIRRYRRLHAYGQHL